MESSNTMQTRDYLPDVVWPSSVSTQNGLPLSEAVECVRTQSKEHRGGALSIMLQAVDVEKVCSKGEIRFEGARKSFCEGSCYIRVIMDCASGRTFVSVVNAIVEWRKKWRKNCHGLQVMKENDLIETVLSL